MMRMRWAEFAAFIRQIRNAYNVLVEKPEGKTPFRILWHRWEDNIRMDIRETGLWTTLILIRTGTSGKLFGTW
jgi:hypothetical protein